ncbi:MAG: hypothetical protein ABII79_00245 [bacterium]
MASIHHKKGKGGKKVYYVVVAAGPTRKWLKAGALRDARVLKQQIEEMKNSERVEKLGLVSRNRRIDSFFQDYADYVKLRSAPNTHKRYKAAINAFIAFLTLFHPRLKNLAQVTPAVIEDYQQKRLESIELRINPALAPSPTPTILFACKCLGRLLRVNRPRCSLSPISIVDGHADHR